MEQRIRDVAVRSFQQQQQQQQQQQDGRNNPESNGESSSGGGVAREDQAIRWERFLPRKNLRVLLVENDDSTRHIVAALLRKCSYQVAAVADGLKAWKVLKERDYNFDLVLTEVAMPSLSGIGLLSKIMSTEMCKNIPVIMMSSHDSIGIVFKCMLKGAADFLVKPVRKNELRNLWQHVWRKYCASNGGDGLENENSNNNKPEAASDNEAASNNGNSNAGNRSKISFSSEGNDSESSSSRQDMQTESMKRQEEPLQTDYKSTAFESDSKLEDHEVSMAKAGASSTCEKGNTEDNSTDMEIKLTLSIHKAVSSENVREKNGSYVRSSCWEDHPDPKRRKNGANITPNHLDGNDGMHLPSRQIEFIEKGTSGKFTSQVLEDNHDGEYVAHESLKSGDDQSGSVPLWELSLRSQLKCQDKEVFQGKHVLKHSKGSAFSRYVDERSHLVCPRSSSSSSHIKNNECGSSNRQISSNDDNCRNTPLTERATSSHVYGGEASIQRQLSFGTHKEGTEPSSSTPSREDIVGRFPNGTAVSHHLQFGGAPVSIPGAIPFQNWCSGYGTILQPFFQPDPSVSFRGSAEALREPVAVPSNPYTDNCNQLNSIPQHGNRHFYYGNHHTPQLMQGSEEQRVERIAIVNGSKGIHKDVGVPSNAGVAIETGSERDRSLREAALTKFRLKRKDRCFEKKVRYHNRKKLAEQRPRLKGQFVCRAVTELNSAAQNQMIEVSCSPILEIVDC